MGHVRPSVSTREAASDVTSTDFRTNGEAESAHTRLSSYVFSTRNLPAKQQFDAYCNVFSVFGDPSLPEDKTPACGFSAERTGYDVGALSIVMSSCDAYSFTKSARQASANILDHWVLVLRRSGWADIDFGSSVQRFEGRRLELRSIARPVRGRLGTNESTFVYLPRSQFAGMEALLDAIAHTDSNLIHPLLSDYIWTLSSILPNITAPEGSLAADATVAMVRACTSHSTDAIMMAQSPIMATRFEIAKRHIEQNLRSQYLTPESIQAKLAVSRRQLYKIFERQGGPAHYIRSRRLAACHWAITDPKDKRTIGAIAASYGFTDTAQFSRQFRAEFGYSASEAREVGRTQQPRQSDFVDWLRRTEPA